MPATALPAPLAESGDRLHESVAFEPGQDIGNAAWRAEPGVGDTSDRGVDEVTVEVDLGADEVVGANRLDVPWGEAIGRKVPQVVRDDQLGPCADGCRQDVPVSRVRKGHRLDQGLVPDDEHIADGGGHQVTCSSQPCRVQVRAIVLEAAESLVQDRVPSTWLEPAPLGRSG
jgi:hypothetical protein